MERAETAGTYTTLEGDLVALTTLTDEERAFLARAYAVYKQDTPWIDFKLLISGRENPLVHARGGRVTREVWAHPLFQAVRDLEDRLGLQQGVLDDPALDPYADPFEDAWVPVSEAAREKCVTVQGLHKAIERGALVARPATPGSSRLEVSVRSLARWTPMAVRQQVGRAGGMAARASA